MFLGACFSTVFHTFEPQKVGRTIDQPRSLQSCISSQPWRRSRQDSPHHDAQPLKILTPIFEPWDEHHVHLSASVGRVTEGVSVDDLSW